MRGLGLVFGTRVRCMLLLVLFFVLFHVAKDLQDGKDIGALFRSVLPHLVHELCKLAFCVTLLLPPVIDKRTLALLDLLNDWRVSMLLVERPVSGQQGVKVVSHAVHVNLFINTIASVLFW